MCEIQARQSCRVVMNGLVIRRPRVQVFLSDHLDLFHGSTAFKSSATLINNQLVSLPPFGVFKKFPFHLPCYFLSLTDFSVVTPQAAQAHASRKRGIYKLFIVLEPGRDLRERPILGYKRPLTILYGNTNKLLLLLLYGG